MARLSLLYGISLILFWAIQTHAVIGTLEDAERYWDREWGREFCEYRFPSFGKGFGCGRLKREMEGTTEPGMRQRMAREFWVMQVLDKVWKQERAQIGRYSPAFRRMAQYDHENFELNPYTGEPHRNQLNTDRIPKELKQDVDKIQRRFRERALKYIARVDELWRTRRPKQKLELHDVIGEDEHRPLWDVAAVKAAEKYLNSFYSADVRRARFWKTDGPEKGLEIPQRLMKVRPLPRKGDGTWRRPDLRPHDFDAALKRFRQDHRHSQSQSFSGSKSSDGHQSSRTTSSESDGQTEHKKAHEWWSTQANTGR